NECRELLARKCIATRLEVTIRKHLRRENAGGEHASAALPEAAQRLALRLARRVGRIGQHQRDALTIRRQLRWRISPARDVITLLLQQQIRSFSSSGRS